MPKGRKPDTQPIKSAMRTLALLEYFRRVKASAAVTEISAALGIPQSSTSVLLKSLVSLNYLEYDAETRRFLPSYRVALLGDWIQRARFGDERITDIMERLQDDTGETVMLGQQIGAGLQYLHVVQTTYRIQFMVHVGEIRPISRTGLGQILRQRLSRKWRRSVSAASPRPKGAQLPGPTRSVCWSDRQANRVYSRSALVALLIAWMPSDSRSSTPCDADSE